MAATGLASGNQTFSGLRRLQLRRDLADIADLIEYCFAPTMDAAGRAAINEMRIISRSGPLLWLLGRLNQAMPGLGEGFVWIEKGRLVGNVSLSPAGFGKGWVIANVAVYPDYRRHGIARQLMEAALDFVSRRGTFATLQVEADNTPARRLYESLGFAEQRTFIHWRRATHHHIPAAPPDMPPIRQMRRHEARSLYNLALEVRPNERGGMGWLRPVDPADFRPSFWDGFKHFASGQMMDFYVVPGPDGLLDAVLLAERRIGGLSALFDVLVRPELQGQLEASLINETIRRLGGRFQPLVTDHPADDAIMGETLRLYQFKPERTLVHMIRFKR
jgi:GNAT superfamily N-acetyltransferase